MTERPSKCLKGYKVPPISRVRIRAIVDEFRKMIGGEFVQNLEIVTERLLEAGLLCVISDREMAERGVEGFYSPSEGCVFLSDSTYAACLDRSNPRALFTLAHELGHLALGHELALNLEVGLREEHQIYEDSEWQANTFASELLMPEDIIRLEELFFPESLCDRFGVSFEAARVRLTKLGLLCI